MISKLSGKIVAQKTIDNKSYTQIIEAAPDVFTKPSVFKIVSDSPLGADNSIIDLDVEITGYVKENVWTDKQTGQQKQYDQQHIYIQSFSSSK